jgi:hypothetical protein
MKLLSRPLGCQEPKGWLPKPEIATQLGLVSHSRHHQQSIREGNQLKFMFGEFHIVQRCHSKKAQVYA